MAFDALKKGLDKVLGREMSGTDYIEVDVGQEIRKNKVIIKPFVLKQYDDVNEILEALREGYTIAIIDIKVLKGKDMIELKRAISKIKKTADAIEGSVAAFGENTVIVTPQFAEIHKTLKKEPEKKNPIEDDMY